jgi:hypothetical protein
LDGLFDFCGNELHGLAEEELDGKKVEIAVIPGEIEFVDEVPDIVVAISQDLSFFAGRQRPVELDMEQKKMTDAFCTFSQRNDENRCPVRLPRPT